MKILLIGPQGSGKSTQGKFLSQVLNIPYISTGDIFRNISTADSDEGRRIKEILESGKLVDDETTIKLVKQRLEESDCKDGFILDGIPRTTNQEENLGVKFDKVLYLTVPKEIVLERLLKRGRVDDTKDLINKRLQLYFEQTQPLLDLYKQQGSLIEVNATSDIQTVQDEIKKSL